MSSTIAHVTRTPCEMVVLSTMAVVSIVVVVFHCSWHVFAGLVRVRATFSLQLLTWLPDWVMFWIMCLTMRRHGCIGQRRSRY